MTQFDPSIIKSVADSLYKRANSITYTYTTLGALIGCVIGFALTTPNTDLIILLISSLLCALIGLSTGKNKAASIKLEAQKILLDLQIEKNTRKADAT